MNSKFNKLNAIFIFENKDINKNVDISVNLTNIFKIVYNKHLFDLIHTVPDESMSSGDNTGSDDELDTCQDCSETQYCERCFSNNLCGCRFTAKFFYLGYNYISKYEKILDIDQVKMIDTLVVEISSFDNLILGGAINYRQFPTLPNNHLMEGTNIVAIYGRPDETIIFS